MVMVACDNAALKNILTVQLNPVFKPRSLFNARNFYP